MTAVRSVFSLLMVVLREIFDESAYQRFLSRKGMVPSASAYAAFLHEMQHVKERRPRCC
jgi:hypothetical protein